MTDKEKDTVESTETVEQDAEQEARRRHDHDHDCDHDHEHDEDELTFVEDPVFDVDYKGDCAYEVKVTIPYANKKKQSEELLEEIQGEAEVPGFRKGRAPRKLVERKFSKHVRKEVESKLVAAAFRKLVDDQDLYPISYPAVDGLSEDEDAGETPIEATLTFEVGPRVTLGEYKGLKVERPVLKVEDKNIDEVLDGMRQRFAVYETLEGGVAAEGDQVIMDFKGTIGGEAFEGGSADNYPYILGSGHFFPEFEKALAGASAGDNLNVQVTFPAEYVPHLANKTADFAITVNEVKRRNAPELNDEFAKLAGYESVSAMREGIADRMSKEAEKRGNRVAEHAALEQVIACSEYELPKSMVERAAREYFEREERRLRTLHVSASEIKEKEEEILQKAHDEAAHDIKAVVTVSEIGKAEGVEISEEDWEQEAEAIAERSGADMELIGKFLAQKEQRSEYEERIFRRKAVAALMSHATVTDKQVEREELEKRENEAGE